MSADFFEGMYAGAGGDDTGVPWQHAISRRLIGDWFETFEPGGRQRARVVAAGLGDDAAALADLGLDVVAFDVAPTAVDWARDRHPDADVDWQVADLFAPPAEWVGSFDLVVEVFTIQSIRPTDQHDAATAICSFVAPGGTLVAVAMVHDGRREPQGPPWPIHPSTLDVLTDGFTESKRRTEPLGDGLQAILVELTRPGGQLRGPPLPHTGDG